jgi:hypothetical protein
VKHNRDLKFPNDAWLCALSSYFGETITQATKKIKRLEGGTVADVFLVKGMAMTSSCVKMPYSMIWKYTKKWNRPGDALSWRREFDWVQSHQNVDLGIDLKMPICYHKEIDSDGNHLWMEYISGISGNSLTLSMLEKTAFLWGMFQGQRSIDSELLDIKNLTDTSFLKSELTQWYRNPYDYTFLCSDQCSIQESIKDTIRKNNWDDGFSITYHYIRSEACDLPNHLKQMIIDLDDSRETVFSHLSRLPLVISHRDLWNENVFDKKETIYLIDWDCIGQGFLGEDIASLIADGTETKHLNEWFDTLFASYKKGFSTHKDASILEASDVVLMILIKYGYRLVDQYWFSESMIEKDDITMRLSLFHDWLHRT